ncbi:MAG: ROK family protein [Planctomycetales bacterium]|nr:ROK family protein [Planctomycetales bacterium]
MANATPTTTRDEAQRPLFAGVDVGGTNIKFGIVDDGGQTISQSKIVTDSDRGPDDGMRRIAVELRRLCAETGVGYEELRAVGLATPGTMDIAAGVLLTPHNLPSWSNYPIRDRLRAECGKPVSFANDANAAAFGEYWAGSGRDHNSIVMVTLGTGVGGGIIIGGRSLDGEHSHGGEVGHIMIDCSPEARICPCGLPGHLEGYCSATAVVRRANELLDGSAESSLRQRMEEGETLTTLMMAEEAERGDKFCRDVIFECAHYLSIGIVTLVHLVDPNVVVLGGAMDFGGEESQLGREFIGAIRAEFARLPFPTLVETTRIDFAQLGGDAGYIGAAGIARALHV